MEEAGQILRHLELGSRPVTIRDLAARFSLPRRTVEAAIQSLRLDGHPVRSGSEGVWLAASAAEAEEAAQDLRRRLVTQYRSILAMRRTARRMRAREAGYTAQSELGL